MAYFPRGAATRAIRVSHPESNQHSVPNYGAIPVKATMHYFGEVIFIKQPQG